MPTEYYRRRREIIAQMRATGTELLAAAEQMEAELPPADGDGEDGDEVAQARTARERARRLGWGGLIRGTGVAVAVVSLGRWIQNNAAPAALLAAAGAAAGTLALTPLVAPVLGGGNGDRPVPAVTRTVVAQPPPESPSPSSSPAPSLPPSPSSSPAPSLSPAPTAAPGAPAPAPSPTPTPTGGGPTAAPTATATTTPSSRPPATPPPAAEPTKPPATPPPVVEVEERTECALAVQIDPLLGVCVLPG